MVVVMTTVSDNGKLFLTDRVWCLLSTSLPPASPLSLPACLPWPLVEGSANGAPFVLLIQFLKRELRGFSSFFRLGRQAQMIARSSSRATQMATLGMSRVIFVDRLKLYSDTIRPRLRPTRLCCKGHHVLAGATY